MKYAMYLIVIAALVTLGMLAFVRLSPIDAARWHVPVTADQDKDMIGGATRVIAADPDVLTRVDAALRALPRTNRIAGSPETGRVTYVTRSKWIGFPDFTTAEFSDGMLRMHARLRFGRSDFGVNRERLQWLLVAAKG